MANGSLNGFLFDVEHFFGSTACQRMSFQEKGVYLVMLFQQWRSPTQSLPDDPAAVADLIAVTPAQAAEVAAAWPVVRGKFLTSRRSDQRIYNRELERVRRRQRLYLQNRANAGRLGGKSKARNRQQTQELEASKARAVLGVAVAKPRDLIREGEEKSRSEKRREEGPPPTARSKRPIFTGTRFVLFEWQLDDLRRLLGDQALEAFELDAFLHDLNAKAERSGQIVPQRDGGAWLQAQVLAEARKRGLTVAEAPSVAPTNKRIAGLVAGGQAFLRREQS